MALDATPGGASANSYLTVVEADAYMDTRLFNDGWEDAESSTKASALMWGTRLLDAAFQWTGGAASETQALCWPRVGMLTRNGVTIDESTLPVDLKAACAEFARQLVVDDRSEDNEALRRGLSLLQVGPVKMQFKDSFSSSVELRNTDIIRQWPQLAYVSQLVPDAVRQLLPASWYRRELLTRPFVFEVAR